MHLIFDFNGTICDSLEAAIKIVNNVLLENKLEPISRQEVKKYGIKKIIKLKKIPKNKFLKIVAEYRKKSSSIYDHVSPVSKLTQIISKLSAKYKLSILTTNSKKNVKKFLKRSKMESCFGSIYSEPDLFGKDKTLRRMSKKHKPNKNIYYIGDETRDIDAAKKAGIKSVAVTWGAESKKALSESNPDIIINQPKDLLKIPF